MNLKFVPVLMCLTSIHRSTVYTRSTFYELSQIRDGAYVISSGISWILSSPSPRNLQVTLLKMTVGASRSIICSWRLFEGENVSLIESLKWLQVYKHFFCCLGCVDTIKGQAPKKDVKGNHVAYTFVSGRETPELRPMYTMETIPKGSSVLPLVSWQLLQHLSLLSTA